mgnify:CR=1 FL=1
MEDTPKTRGHTVTASKHLVLLSVSAGAGHVRAAASIEARAAEACPDLRVTHIDVMDLVSRLFRRVYVTSYLRFVERHPALWGCLYDWTDRHESDHKLQQLRAAVERLHTRKLVKTLRDLNPDCIVCTHFLPAQLLSRLIRRGKLTCPVWVQVTDFDVHLLWIHPYLAGYFAANDEVAWRMRARGLAAERTHITGIPVMPSFGLPHDRSACARQAGLDAHRFTILLTGGGVGMGNLERTAEHILTLSKSIQVVVLAGRNEATLNRLQTMAARYPSRLFPMGFTRHVDRLMAASDLAITKPGGLTTSECLAMRLPMILVSPIPGQEERNADYLLEHGAALKAVDPAALQYRVQLLLNNPGMLHEMRDRIEMIRRPDAAGRLLRTLFGRLEARTQRPRHGPHSRALR